MKSKSQNGVRMPHPLLSIVIANYNYGHFLEEAIQSVVTQGVGDQVELIICDAASTDNSVEIIKKYANGLPPNTRYEEFEVQSGTTNGNRSKLQPSGSKLISWWCSEKDKGQSDAFNKAFSHANGKFGCWLNADDVLMPGALKSVVNYLEKHHKCEWLGGSSVFADKDFRVKWCSRCIHVWRNGLRKFPMYSVNGPSSFFLIDNLKKMGGFDVSLRYTMDTDLWRRFAHSGIVLHHIPNYVWCFRVHEDSKTSHKFITGKGSDSFSTEGIKMNGRYGITPFRSKIGSLLNRCLRLMAGVYLRSYIDTCRYKGKPIEVIGVRI